MIIAWGLMVVFILLAIILLISIFNKDQSEFVSTKGSRFIAMLTMIFLALVSAQVIWG